MKKKLMSILLALAAAGALTLGAAAENAGTEDEYIYVEAEIVETYNSEYGLYEQLLDGQIAFYTNVSNGAITSDAVTIELPESFMTQFTKDGTELEFRNSRPITEPGIYSLTVIARGSDMFIGSEDELFYGFFRFRIMDESPAGEGFDQIGGETAEPTEEAPAATSTPESTEPPAQSGAPQESGSAPEQTTASAGTGGTDTSGGENAPVEAEPMPEGDITLISQKPDGGRVALVTKAGTLFYSNIPFGAVTSKDVRFIFSAAEDEELRCELYRDGVRLDYNPAADITRKGKYRLFIYDGSGTKPAEFDFEIMGRYVREMTRYSVPQGCEITEATFDGTALRANGSSVDLGGEGSYSVTVNYDGYVYTESFVLDNTKPQFSLDRVTDGKAYGGTVTVTLLSEDTDYYEIIKDGAPAERQSLEISDPGVYTINVHDKAGNVTTYTFELEYRMNEMAIVVIIVLIAVVVAAVVFFVRSRKKFFVR